MPRKAEGSINPIKALNNSCKRPHLALSLVLRAGPHRKRLALEAAGAGLDNSNDNAHEYGVDDHVLRNMIRKRRVHKHD